jgi:hypothetical protein
MQIEKPADVLPVAFEYQQTDAENGKDLENQQNEINLRAVNSSSK